MPHGRQGGTEACPRLPDKGRGGPGNSHEQQGVDILLLTMSVLLMSRQKKLMRRPTIICACQIHDVTTEIGISNSYATTTLMTACAARLQATASSKTLSKRWNWKKCGQQKPLEDRRPTQNTHSTITRVQAYIWTWKSALSADCVWMPVPCSAQKIHAIGFAERGSGMLPITAFDKPLKDTGCISCGQCTLCCPVGTLIERPDWH